MAQKKLNSNSLFGKPVFNNIIVKQPSYIMGIDTYDKNVFVYCLSRKVGDNIEILLSKTMYNEEGFKKETENLIDYFNADVFKI
jgi:hypothetical protein